MPKGKGTYGSQVGRPPQDARNRNAQEYAGGGKTGYSQIGMYEKGGKVSDAVQRRIDAAPKARENLKKHAKNLIGAIGTGIKTSMNVLTAGTAGDVLTAIEGGAKAVIEKKQKKKDERAKRRKQYKKKKEIRKAIKKGDII